VVVVAQLYPQALGSLYNLQDYGEGILTCTQNDPVFDLALLIQQCNE
jgi:hypothetical protein